VVQITIEDQGATARVLLKGRMDAEGANAIALPFNALVEAKRGIIVDLAGVTFLSSFGIRSLMAAAKTLTRTGGRLVLINPSADVNEVLAITGVGSLIPVARSDQEARTLLTISME
jgi:anti-anti-sigma factor